MVLESTIVCVDNSEWMRNGDFLPTRIQAQQDAVSVICNAKTRSNPENNVALMTSGSLEVLCNLTTGIKASSCFSIFIVIKVLRTNGKNWSLFGPYFRHTLGPLF